MKKKRLQEPWASGFSKDKGEKFSERRMLNVWVAAPISGSG